MSNNSMLLIFDAVPWYLQDLVYKLSEVGQAIENDDLPRAGSVFGSGSDIDFALDSEISEWEKTGAFIINVKCPEEKTEVGHIQFLTSFIGFIRCAAYISLGEMKYLGSRPYMFTGPHHSTSILQHNVTTGTRSYMSLRYIDGT
ncbi:hypothetical protein VNO77_24278 [Canavalia gladiata]|uniref:Maintenance of Photosystem II under High light 2 C-terminal domain-containing protein n=1 Tax=Canavalia gladiata TaxID=3824 RepID=A0AAN9QCG7_CANGL